MLIDSMRETLEGRIIAKAWESQSYKAALRRDPRSVILAEMKDEFGSDEVIPDDWKISVHEETTNSFHLVIPLHLDEQPDVMSVADVSPVHKKDCNTPDGSRCGCCTITRGNQSKCTPPPPPR